MPDYGVGGWVMLHKKAFGPGGTESKLVSEECVGPFKALLDKGRVEVELDRTRYTKHKTNIFILEHVRKFFQRRPWGHDQISLDEHLSAPWEDDAEFEVDKVVGRRWMHNQYKYSVSYKGRSDDVSKYYKRDDARFGACTDIIDDYDKEFPFGSLRRDEPSARRQHDDEHKESRRSGRLNNRRLNLALGPNTDCGTDTRDLGRHNKAARLGRRRELVLRRTGQVTLQLFIRTTAGTIPVRASPNETVRGLQQRLEGGRGLCKGLRLRYQGKDMDESATLRVFQLRDFATLDSLGPLRGGMILGISANHLTSWPPSLARDDGAMTQTRPMPAIATPPPYSEGVWSDRVVRHRGGEMNFVYQNSYTYHEPGNAPPSDEDIEDDLDRVGVELFLEGSEVGYVRMVS
jgi:hypothetical protein